MVIREMRAEDVAAVTAVDLLCMRPPWSAETFAVERVGRVSVYLVAADAGDVVGYLGGRIVAGDAHLTTFGVHPQHRRRGIGERLLAEFLRRAVADRCERVTLEVREGNAAAIGLYRKYGFSAVSRRRRYYDDNDEDAIVMWINDPEKPAFRELLSARLAELAES